MGVNLNNLNISLDQFNAVSSGKYNIGQLKLGEDGASVYRTNNHKTLTFLNGESVSPEESLALKFTFCKALAGEGLSREDIEAVKRKLGIAGGPIDVVRAGGVTPLSAADVRQIIDEYAGKINERRAAKAGGAEALQTSGELYRGVSQRTLESRAAARDSVNARTVEHMMSAADHSVNALLDMLQFTGESGAETMNFVQKGMAKEILKAGSTLSDGKSIELTTANIKLSLGPGETVVATFRLDSGNTFAVDTGLDRDALLDQMNVVAGNKQAGRAEEAGKAEEKSGATAGDAKKALLEDLKRAFALASNAEERQRMEDEAFRNGPTLGKTGKPLSVERRKAKAREKVRDKFSTVLDPLRQALKEARPLDARNAKLVNDVRDVLAGDTKIDTKGLLKEISDTLDTKIVDSREKVAKQLEEGIADDLDTNLNIDAWLERT